MFRWYAVNTYSGHENKVKQNLEHRVVSLGQERNVRQIVIPTEQVSEMKDGQKVQTERRTMPGYVLVNMDLNEDSWTLVKGTPGVTGFVGAQQKPVPLSQTEIDLTWQIKSQTQSGFKVEISTDGVINYLFTFGSGENLPPPKSPMSETAGEPTLRSAQGGAPTERAGTGADGQT